MSPFTRQQELWLTNHLQRLVQHEQATKIQAVVRGFLVRRREQKERKAQDVLNDVLRRLAVPREPVSVVGLMRQLNLHPWADQLPSAAVCVYDMNARAIRHHILSTATLALRLTGQTQYVADLQWADYHERYRALQESFQPPEEPQPPRSMWSRLTQWIWGH